MAGIGKYLTTTLQQLVRFSRIFYKDAKSDSNDS